MISWSHLRLTNWSWDQNCLKMLYFNFNLMIDLLAARTIMRSKLKKALLGNFDLMKNAAIRRSNLLLGISTSWKMKKNLISWIRPHEKSNFDLMKFNLLIISLCGAGSRGKGRVSALNFRTSKWRNTQNVKTFCQNV